MLMNFERGRDPRVSMDIGHVHDVKKWLDEYDIIQKQIDAEGEGENRIFFVDIEGDVIFKSFTLEDIVKIPKNIKFREVTGRFIFGNKN